MRISDWSSDVCSSDLHVVVGINSRLDTVQAAVLLAKMAIFEEEIDLRQRVADGYAAEFARAGLDLAPKVREGNRSEEHTSELQSLMRISYAVLCLKKKNN